MYLGQTSERVEWMVGDQVEDPAWWRARVTLSTREGDMGYDSQIVSVGYQVWNQNE